jgi:large subunit ribosomal protein L17
MRHRKKGRKLGRNPSHQRALLRSLVSALMLTERDAEFDDNQPKVKGRIITTISKAKEVRPLVEKCVTIARRSLAAVEAAAQHATSAERGSQEWKSWRTSATWNVWNQAIAPSIAARRRCLRLIGDKQAVSVLFDEIAPRFADRPGGYTRIVRLAKPRLGDAGTRAILEFVGVRDRVLEKSQKPSFDDSPADSSADETPQDEVAEETATEAGVGDTAADDTEAGDTEAGDTGVGSETEK